MSCTFGLWPSNQSCRDADNYHSHLPKPANKKTVDETRVEETTIAVPFPWRPSGTEQSRRLARDLQHRSCCPQLSSHPFVEDEPHIEEQIQSARGISLRAAQRSLQKRRGDLRLGYSLVLQSLQLSGMPCRPSARARLKKMPYLKFIADFKDSLLAFVRKQRLGFLHLTMSPMCCMPSMWQCLDASRAPKASSLEHLIARLCIISSRRPGSRPSSAKHPSAQVRLPKPIICVLQSLRVAVGNAVHLDELHLGVLL